MKSISLEGRSHNRDLETNYAKKTVIMSFKSDIKLYTSEGFQFSLLLMTLFDVKQFDVYFLYIGEPQ